MSVLRVSVLLVSACVRVARVQVARARVARAFGARPPPALVDLVNKYILKTHVFPMPAPSLGSPCIEIPLYFRCPGQK